MSVKVTGAVLSLLVAAGGGAADSTTTTSQGPTATTTTAAAVTPTTGKAVTTTAPLETTTTEAPADSGPEFVLSIVTFGAGPMIVITNIGNETGNLGGHWLCQRPDYWEFPEIEVPAGQRVAVSAGGNVFLAPPGALVVEGQASVGALDPADGEIGLYNAQSFSSSDAILSYVEWGKSGHGRSSVAVDAGIWPDGGFVATSADTISLFATSLPATSIESWDAG
jgi:hypothetical protein